jgi:hypothetical protein
MTTRFLIETSYGDTEVYFITLNYLWILEHRFQTLEANEEL